MIYFDSCWKTFFFYLSVFLLAFSITVLFLGMRGIMDIGGMVAVGGPYEIAHPAPDWIWLIPVSIFLGIFSVFINLFLSHQFNYLSLITLGWPGLFLSGGWNFFEYGLNPPGEGGWAWGWLVCGVVFFLMGSVPLFIILKNATVNIKNLRMKRENMVQKMKQSVIDGWTLHINRKVDHPVIDEKSGDKFEKINVLIQIVLIAAAIYTAGQVFNLLVK